VTTPEEDNGKENLERRAHDSRARLLDAIDALERRGARLVATARGLRQVATLAVDAVAVIGALMSLVSLVKTSDHRGDFPSRKRGTGGVLGRLAMLAVFAGVAYIARPRGRSAPTSGAAGVPRSRLRAIS